MDAAHIIIYIWFALYALGVVALGLFLIFCTLFFLRQLVRLVRG